MTVIVLIGLALALLAVVHRLPLDRVAPLTAASVWLLALAVRAVVVMTLATFAFTQLAYAPVVERALSWCWHEILPDVPGRLGFAEQPVAHAAVAVPAFALALALAMQACEVVRTRLRLRRSFVPASGPGPHGTRVIRDDAIVVAVTRYGRGQIVLSDRALDVMDAGELAAGVAHESAHIHRSHRQILLVAAILARIGRPFPGTAAAERELSFELERDADADAVRRLQDPLSLASAICKAATTRTPAGLASLSGTGSVSRRLAELVDGRSPRSGRIEVAARGLAAALTGVTLALAAGTAAWALDAPADSRSNTEHRCSHHR